MKVYIDFQCLAIDFCTLFYFRSMHVVQERLVPFVFNDENGLLSFGNIVRSRRPLLPPPAAYTRDGPTARDRSRIAA